MGLKAVSRTIAGAADYEVGTWVPKLEGTTVAGSHTYAIQAGRFVRLGPLVWVVGAINLSNFDPSTSGFIRLTGLPHVVSSIVGLSSTMAVGNFRNIDLNVSAGYYFPIIEAQQGDSHCTISESGDGVSPSALTEADFSSASALRVVGSYTTDLD